MKLVPIDRNDFSLWKDMRSDLYRTLDDEYNFKEMEKIFDNAIWHCQFIEDHEKIVGFIELSLRNIVDGCLSSPVPYLEGLYIKPAYRGKGLGRKVISILIQWCSENGFSEMATDTEITNEKAQRFYESVGFKEVDRVVEYRIEVSDP